MQQVSQVHNTHNCWVYSAWLHKFRQPTKYKIQLRVDKYMCKYKYMYKCMKYGNAHYVARFGSRTGVTRKKAR